MIYCTTGAYVSKNSIPSLCKSPRAQKQALKQNGMPSGRLLSLNAQIPLSTLRSEVQGIDTHVFWLSNVIISSFIALINSSESGPLIA